MDADARYSELDRLATEYFQTKRWKVLFADRYGITRQSVQNWKQNGAPTWPLVAIRDAMSAQTVAHARQSLLDTLDAIHEA